MPCINKWESEGLYRQFTGIIGGDEILESNFELHADSKFQTIDYVISDFTAVIGHSIDVDHTRIYTSTDEMISKTKGKLKIALVATEKSIVALADRYREEMAGNRFECGVFKVLANG